MNVGPSHLPPPTVRRGHPPAPTAHLPPPVPGTGLGAQSPGHGIAQAVVPPPVFTPPTQPTSPVRGYISSRGSSPSEGQSGPVSPSSLPVDKSVGLAYVLWLFLGLIGVHHFYIGKVGRGIGYLLTLGWFTIGWWVDLFTLASQVRRRNMERRMGLR